MSTETDDVHSSETATGTQHARKDKGVLPSAPSSAKKPRKAQHNAKAASCKDQKVDATTQWLTLTDEEKAMPR